MYMYMYSGVDAELRFLRGQEQDRTDAKRIANCDFASPDGLKRPRAFPSPLPLFERVERGLFRCSANQES